jgi:hypothetical protein
MIGTRELEDMRTKAWPWTPAFNRRLRELRATPFAGSHLFFGSDYSGDHTASRFRVYAFVIVDTDASPEWPTRAGKVRRSYLPDGRRMSFKNLNDGHRRRALVPFLEAAEFLHGHVVAVAITKELEQLSTAPGTVDQWRHLHGLRGNWNQKAFENMVRVSHFFALFMAAWSSPGMHVTWITDNDSIVANDDRLDDAHQLAARLSAFYSSHNLGVFAMNTVSIDDAYRGFEDIVSIPDLAAGMVAEVVGLQSRKDEARELKVFDGQTLSEKSDIIADWFWHCAGSLKKSCILIDRRNENTVFVGQINMGTL